MSLCCTLKFMREQQSKTCHIGPICSWDEIKKKNEIEILLKRLDWIFLQDINWYCSLVTSKQELLKYHKSNNELMFMFLSAWKMSINTNIGGIGILLSPCALKPLNSIEKNQPRMMCATFDDNPCKTIVSCYCPTYSIPFSELISWTDI